MADPRYAMLRAACNGTPRAKVATRLGVSAAVVSQVLNGSGAYGSGKASTAKVFAKVEANFGHWPCPHLTEQSNDGQPQVITAARCRELAHRTVPTGSPRDLAHWQACRKCPHYLPTTPPTPRPVVPRKPRQAAAAPIPASTGPADIDPTPSTQPAQEGIPA
jgi:hypothetical protein